MLEEAGLSGIILEKYGDSPFLKMVTEETVAGMAVVAHEIKGAVRIPVE